MKNLIWIASYPRSGNTWFRMALSCLLSNEIQLDINAPKLDQIANSRGMFDTFSGLRSSELTAKEILKLRPKVYQLLSKSTAERVYLKTHDQFASIPGGGKLFPADCSFGCIYIIRNPLDVAVSCAAYFGKTIDETIRDMNDPDFTLNSSKRNLIPVLEEKTGNWSNHAESWMSSSLPLLFIRYEEMLADPRATLLRAMNFLELDLPAESVDRAIAATSFSALKSAETNHGFKEKRQKADAFFRSGKAGDWQTKLSTEQRLKIIRDHGKTMNRFGYQLIETK
jgi:hypothetical protein